MQITLDLPDEAFAVVDAVAKRESRSLAQVIADFVLGRSQQPPQPALPPTPEAEWTMPVVPCVRSFNNEDVARWEAEDDSQ